MNVTFHSAFLPNSRSYYAVYTKYLGMFDDIPKSKTIYLHRIIMDVLENDNPVDHRDHDTLNNRKYNLRVSLCEENTKHRKSKNKNNKSGYRNVFWDKSCSKWAVHLQVNSKNTCLGRFDDVDEAGKFAEEMRNKYYGKFKGVS